MIEQSDPNYSKLKALFEDHPDLFSLIPNEFLLREDSEDIYRDGESDLIRLENRVYRFNWEDVETFGIDIDYV